MEGRALERTLTVLHTLKSEPSEPKMLVDFQKESRSLPFAGDLA